MENRIFDYYLAEARRYEATEIAEKKKEMLDKKDDDYRVFYPNLDDIKSLPKNSVLIKIEFTLAKPYTSKAEGEFWAVYDKENNRQTRTIKIIENAIVRDKFTGKPLVKPSTWKGHLRFVAEQIKMETEKKKQIIERLFGNDPEKKEASLKGRLYFFPTFFENEAEKDVITPLDRRNKTPVENRSPITLEVMKPKQKGKFYLLYFPYPKTDDDNKEKEYLKDDLKFLAKALRLMFYEYGFSAKKTSGFGVIEKKLSGKFQIKLGSIEEGNFSVLEEKGEGSLIKELKKCLG